MRGTVVCSPHWCGRLSSTYRLWRQRGKWFICRFERILDESNDCFTRYVRAFWLFFDLHRIHKSRPRARARAHRTGFKLPKNEEKNQKQKDYTQIKFQLLQDSVWNEDIKERSRLNELICIIPWFTHQFRALDSQIYQHTSRSPAAWDVCTCVCVCMRALPKRRILCVHPLWCPHSSHQRHQHTWLIDMFLIHAMIRMGTDFVVKNPSTFSNYSRPNVTDRVRLSFHKTRWKQ